MSDYDFWDEQDRLEEERDAQEAEVNAAFDNGFIAGINAVEEYLADKYMDGIVDKFFGCANMICITCEDLIAEIDKIKESQDEE